MNQPMGGQQQLCTCFICGNTWLQTAILPDDTRTEVKAFACAQCVKNGHPPVDPKSIWIPAL